MLVSWLVVYTGAESQNSGLSSQKKKQHDLSLNNSSFSIRKVLSIKIHFYTVEESTKEIFIGTKILAAEFLSSPS